MDSTKKAASRSSWKRYVPDAAVMLGMYAAFYPRVAFLAFLIWFVFVLRMGQGTLVVRCCGLVLEWWRRNR